MVYAFFDGDNIGASLEILLRENQVLKAMRLSEDIKLAMQNIEVFLASLEELKVIIIGGDDILVELHDNHHIADFLETVRAMFFETTKHSMSVGVGEDIPSAVQNLYLAKLYGKDKIVGMR